MRERSAPARLAVRLAKRFVVGTPLEAPVKRAHAALTGSKNSLYDALTIDVMRRVLRPDSNAVDIGAFEGAMLRHILRFAPRGRHLAFEPLPGRAEQLQRAFPGVRVYPCALGETPGETSFHHVIRYPALSGLKRRVDLESSEDVREERVTVETLDRIIPEETPIALVKMDVEGGELGVFRGAIRTLRRTRPVIVFECGLGGADSYGAGPGEIFDLVTGAIGLRLSLLDAWLSGKDPLPRSAFVDQFERSINFYFIAHP
ncbi:MAG TPA: FkbM family methyltransferase [Candidatus Limnocylindrales bacterium]|nr:FkbM family methyltransferase [Candidatus Limnocylindrales bacterium]